MNKNISDKFIDSIYNLSCLNFSNDLIIQAKRCFLDYLGVSFAGSKILFDKGNKYLDYISDGSGKISVIGFNRKTRLENAVLINGFSSHVAELDDGIRFGAIHPGSPIISALLPIAEKDNISYSQFIKGIIIGYEAAIRLATAIQPSHYYKGFHPTATCGAIGAALGIGIMLGYNKSQMKDSLSAAAVSASGSLKVLEDSSELKPYNSGRAALIGLISSLVAGAGFIGPDDALSGDSGFLSMMANEADLSLFEFDESEQLQIEKVYVKPYAACRHAHPSIEAALNIKFDNNLQISEIKEINVKTYKGVIGKHDSNLINGVNSAKMSIPFSIATSLFNGKAGIDEFSVENVNNLEILSLTNKVRIISDDVITSQVPYKRSAILEITTNDGNLYNHRVDFPKGEPENPLSDDEVKEKFISLATYSGKSIDVCHEMINIVWNIENDFNQIYDYL